MNETVLVIFILSLILVGFAAVFFTVRFLYRKFFLPTVISEVKKELEQG